MTIEETYLQFVNQVNRNLTNNNISVDRPRFVMMFNDISNRYVEWVLNKRNEDVLRHISPLLVVDKKLVASQGTKLANNFKLPKDFFDHSNLSVYASNKGCKRVKLKTWEVKNDDVEELFNDYNTQPSFEFRETFYHFGSDRVLVYKKDFEIDEAFLSYYRYPKKVDIEGYFDVNNNPSSNIDPEFDDKVVGRIIIAMAKSFSANTSDTTNFQIKSNELFESI